MIGSNRGTRLTSSWTCFRCRTLTTSSSRHTQGLSEQRVRQPSQKLPTYPARTRFAPSPTGYLHLGSLRTALYNYLLAKATRGQFLLRVEDTDQKRTVADAEERLYRDLKWAGLQWDEGPDIGGPYGPYKQSERTVLYQKHADILVNSGHAYRCFCSPERRSTKTVEPGSFCSSISRELSEDYALKRNSHVVRLRMPAREPTFEDLVYGIVRGPPRMKNRLGQACFEDPVLVKSDGFPTYHLANVVDDHHMKITHVIRAAEWMSSTPTHVVMYQAFGWQIPLYAHVGLLQDQEHQKYSKRKGDTDLDMRSLEKRGVFPEALVNYVALHGWSYGLGDEFLKLSDLVGKFDLKFTKGNTVVMPNKLEYLQKRYAETYAKDEGPWFNNMVERTLMEVKAGPRDGNDGDSERILICPDEELRHRVTALLRLEARKYTFPREFFDRVSYFFYSENHSKNELRTEPLLEHLGDIGDCFARVSSHLWDISSLNRAVSQLTELIGQAGNGDSATEESRKIYKMQLQSFLRWAVAYGHPGPTIGQTMQILGRKITLERIESAKAVLSRDAPIQD